MMFRVTKKSIGLAMIVGLLMSGAAMAGESFKVKITQTPAGQNPPPGYYIGGYGKTVLLPKTGYKYFISYPGGARGNRPLGNFPITTTVNQMPPYSYKVCKSAGRTPGHSGKITFFGSGKEQSNVWAGFFGCVKPGATVTCNIASQKLKGATTPVGSVAKCKIE